MEELIDDGLGNVGLEAQDIVGLCLPTVGPDLHATVVGIDQLRGDAKIIRDLLYTALEHHEHPETCCEDTHVHLCVSVLEGGRPRGDPELRDEGESVDELF